jgi:hypothetical protein
MSQLLRFYRAERDGRITMFATEEDFKVVAYC